MSKFSENIKALRKQRHITQVQLAEKIGVSRSTISMYEMGEREPDFETLEALADVFNVDMAYLIGTDTKKAPDTEAEGELLEYLEMLRTRPELKLLFHTFKGATKEQIEAIVTAWEARNNVKGE
jgi:transcriptional regulator with XRE-family HTH domain